MTEKAAGAAGLSGLPVVASGGTFCNRMLERDVEEMGAVQSYRTFFHKTYPPTDAGLAFGQAIFARRSH